MFLSTFSYEARQRSEEEKKKRTAPFTARWIGHQVAYQPSGRFSHPAWAGHLVSSSPCDERWKTNFFLRAPLVWSRWMIDNEAHMKPDSEPTGITYNDSLHLQSIVGSFSWRKPPLISKQRVRGRILKFIFGAQLSGKSESATDKENLERIASYFLLCSLFYFKYL